MGRTHTWRTLLEIGQLILLFYIFLTDSLTPIDSVLTRSRSAYLSEDGIDTFGNYGQLRYGHTGAGSATPLVGQRTGTGVNPFAGMQQQQQRQQTGANPDQPFFSI